MKTLSFNPSVLCTYSIECGDRVLWKGDACEVFLSTEEQNRGNHIFGVRKTLDTVFHLRIGKIPSVIGMDKDGAIWIGWSFFINPSFFSTNPKWLLGFPEVWRHG